MKMLKALLGSFFSVSILLSCSSLGPDQNTAVTQIPRPGEMSIRLSPNVEPKMLHASYWIGLAPAAGRVIMSPSQIELWNRKTSELAWPGSNPPSRIIIDLQKYRDGISRSSLLASTMTEPPAAAWYTADGAVSAVQWDGIFSSMNLPSITDKNSTLPGICIRHSNLRVIPSDTFYTNDLDDWYDDMAQICGLLVNEPLVVLHESADQRWLLVSTRCCTGWVHAEDVALLDAFSGLEQYLHPANFITITCDRIRLDPNYFLERFGSGLPLETPELFMGSTLELADWNADSAASAYWAGREAYSSYIVKIPLRAGDGSLDFEYASIPSSLAHPGYLPYTVSNVLNLAFQSLGNCYGWGGQYSSRDCSEYIMELFRCFGFILPRNSRAISLVPGKNQDISAMNSAKRKSVLDRLMPGSILYMPGHTMIYLGKQNGQYFVISAIGSYFPDRADPGKSIHTTDLFSININDLGAVRGNGSTWLDSIKNVITLE